MSDDFENGIGQWEFFAKTTMAPLSNEAVLVDSEDKEHGMVLSLMPGQLISLIKGSEHWSNYKIEGDLYFPKTPASLIGLVYNFNLVPRPNWNGEENRLRAEFGSVYIKCGGSYIRVNPHFDGTAGRALYDDYKTPLTEEAAIRVREWKHFKYEIVGGACHLYVDDMEKPKVTFHGYHHTSGRVGFRPRSGGSECWIDNVQVRTINELSFKGQVAPKSVTWAPGKLITDWEAIGPFKERVKGIEEAEAFQNRTYTAEDHDYRWVSFPTDHRACVISGKICDFNLPGRKQAYFRTLFRSDKNTKSLFRFSSRSDLTVFVNGNVVGNVRKVKHIWPDFWKKTRHAPTDVEVSLKHGVNYITILVDGGQYPGCGFYLYVEEGI
ncbi:hypothetical protein ACFL1X_10695 [Candidatus Hydrogenedentota bacterium]